MARGPKRTKAEPKPVIGWAEWVGLPDLGVRRLKAKVDTGARTSALHVVGILKIGDAPPATAHGEPRPIVELKIPSGTRKGATFNTAQAIIEEFVNIKDSGGHAERRPVIETAITLGDHQTRARVSLTDRGDMMYPMLLGRTALGARFHIDASQRYRLTTRKPKRARTTRER